MDKNVKYDKIEQKIERIENFCKNNQRLWLTRSNTREMQTLLKQIKNRAARKKIEQELEKVKLDYAYVAQRKRNKKLKPEYIEKLKNAGVGGVFGYEYDFEKYNIDKKVLLDINEKYGNLDNFREVYIQAMIDRKHTDIIPEDLEDKLVTSFDVSSPDLVNRKDKYFVYLNEACKGEFGGIKISDISFIDSNNIKDIISEIMRLKLTHRFSTITELRYGLSDEKSSVNEIAKRFNMLPPTAFSIIQRNNIKVKNWLSQPEYFERIDSDNKISSIKREEFIRKFFEKHDIFYNPEDVELDEQTRNELLAIYNDGKTVMAQMDYIHNDGVTSLEIELFIRRISNEANIYFPKNINDLDKKLEYLLINFRGTYDIYMQVAKQKEYLANFTTEQKIEFIRSNIGETVNIRDIFWNNSEDVLKDVIENFNINFNTEEVEISKFSDYYISAKHLDNIISKSLIEVDMSKAIEEWLLKQDKCNETENNGIEKLNLDARSYNALGRAKINSISDLVALDEKQLKRIRNLGKKSIDEIVDKVHELGYEFKKSEEKTNQEESENQEKTSIKKLNLSGRPYKALLRNEVNYVEDLIELDEETLRNTRNIGKKSFDEIIENVHNLGYKFKWEETDKEQENSESELDIALVEYIQKLKNAYAKLNRTEKLCSELRKEVEQEQKQVMNKPKLQKSPEPNLKEDEELE